MFRALAFGTKHVLIPERGFRGMVPSVFIVGSSNRFVSKLHDIYIENNKTVIDAY